MANFKSNEWRSAVPFMQTQRVVCRIIFLLLMLFAVPSTAENAERRTSVGMFMYPGGQSHGFDICEVAMELVNRGVNVFVSVINYDIKPFQRYIEKNSRNVEVAFYDGDYEAASRPDEDAKLWIVRYDPAATDDVREFEVSWLREKHENDSNFTQYTSEITYEDMLRDHKVTRVQMAMQHKDLAVQGKLLFGYTIKYCFDLMNSAISNSAFSSVDMMIIDPASNCASLSAVRFKKPFGIAVFGSLHPYISATSTIQPWVPTMNSGYLPSSMSVWDATANIIHGLKMKYVVLPKMSIGWCDLVENMGIDTEFSISLTSTQCDRVIAYREQMSLVRVFFTELEAPREIYPSELFVGSLTTKPAKPLPLDDDGVAEFVNNADNGFIFISLGTQAAFEMKRTLMIRDAVESLNMRVVWKITGQSTAKEKEMLTRSGRVKLVDWVSQNDILGHPNIRAFFSHVGRHSLEEAAFHGVPLLMMPLFADQSENMFIGLGHNLGIGADQHQFTSESLASDLQQLIARSSDSGGVDSPYYIAAQHLSTRLRSHPKPSIERAGDILERTIVEVVRMKKYGGDPLMLVPRVLRMSYLEYLSPYLLFAGLCFISVTLACILVIGAMKLLLKCLHALSSSLGANVDVFLTFSKITKKDRHEIDMRKKDL